ncbi:hypothetical protein BDZ89DRAFT_1061713 [Hymenopellis radicata]|nr:hypothetical protein BDZ89DRAFT_1061713 [Hymenopellis radicata]
MSSKPTVSQPTTTSMDVYHFEDEKHAVRQHNNACSSCELEANSPCHKRCHAVRMLRFLIPLLVVFLGLLALLGLSCYVRFDPFGFMDGTAIFSRAVDDGTNSGNSFTDNKLYLIVIFVGLFVVLILGICLSAWCCKVFSNPLCIPCYLCACCGGLACLECIGCGLCAEGVDAL